MESTFASDAGPGRAGLAVAGVLVGPVPDVLRQLWLASALLTC